MWLLYAVPPAFLGFWIVRAFRKGRVPSRRWGVFYTRSKAPASFWSTIVLSAFLWLGMLLPLWAALHTAYPAVVPSLFADQTKKMPAPRDH